MAVRKKVREPFLRVLVKSPEQANRWEWVSPIEKTWTELKSESVLTKVDEKTKSKYVPILL